MRPSFFARYGLLILVVSTFLLPLAFAGARRGLRSNRNDVKDWLPAVYEETREFRWFQQHFGGEEFVLVSWTGCTLDDQRLRLLAEKLAPPAQPQAESATLDSVGYTRGEAAALLIAPPIGLPQFEADQLLARSKQSGFWTGVWRTIAREPQSTTPSNIWSARDLVRLLTSRPIGLARHDALKLLGFSLFDQVMTGPSVIQRLTSPPINLSRDEALQRLRGSIIGPDLQQTCVIFTLSDIGQQEPKESVYTIIRVAADECGIPREDLHMGGPPRDNVAIDEAGESSLVRLAAIAGVVGLGISWWCLRSGRLILMVFMTGIYSAMTSLAIVWYTGVNMNAILLTMPSLVYVAAISGAIHLANYYRDTLYEDGLVGAPERALKHAALPLSLATGTTAVGLLSLCYSELVPIKLFGLYSAVGVAASMFFLMLLLPACFQTWPLPRSAPTPDSTVPQADPISSPKWRFVGRAIVDHYVLSGGVCILLLLAVGWGMTQMQTSVQLMRLFSKGAPILGDYRWLEEHLGELVPMEVIVRIDPQTSQLDFLERMELVGRVQQAVEALPQVGSSLSAVTFAPHLPTPDDYRQQRGLSGAGLKIFVRNQYEVARKVTNKRLEQHRGDYLKEDYLAEENGQELWRISARVAALKDVDYGQFVNDIRACVEQVIGDSQQQQARGLHTVYTGLVPLVYKAQRSLLDGLLFGFGLDVVLITIAMILAVREWSAGLILFLPSVFPIFIIFGIMGWLGVIVDTGTVMAPAVALGVTVDDVVHFMLQFRGGLKSGLSRGDAVMVAYKHCARPIYQSWGVIGLGLSAFAFSPFTPTQRFGIMMITLLSAALIGNLVLLPALLASPLGALFGRKFQAANRRRQTSQAGHPPPHPHARMSQPHGAQQRLSADHAGGGVQG